MKNSRKRKKMVPVPMDESLVKKIDEKVAGRFDNRSEFIREACHQMIDHIVMQEKEAVYERGYRAIPENAQWPKATGKIIADVWDNEDWS